MKRFTAVFLCICMILALAACGQSEQAGSSSSDTAESAASSDSPQSEQSSSGESSSGGETSDSSETGAPVSSEAETEASEIAVASEVPKDPLPEFSELQSTDGSLICFTSSEDFGGFTLRKASVEAYGDGAVELRRDGDQYVSEGVCTSPTVMTEDFTELTVSWNATLPLSATVEVEARVKVRQTGSDGSEKELWSDWMSLGEYAPGIERSSLEQQGELASVSKDVISTNGNPAVAFQLQVTLRTSDVSLTPVLRSLYVSVRDARGSSPGEDGEVPDDLNWLVTLQVPSVSMSQCCGGLSSQNVSVPCSLSMLLSQKGEDILPEIIAMSSDDGAAYSFSNLSFEAAFAGASGYTAYAGYTTLAGLKREIAAGNPVGILLSYAGTDIESSSLPTLEGAGGEHTDHMVVLRGFTARNGELYAVVNDPAAESVGKVRRTYRLDQLMNAWDGRALFLREKDDLTASAVEQRTLELRAEDDGCRLYSPGTDELFSYNERTVFMLTKDGQRLSSVQAVHGRLVLLDNLTEGSELWCITDLGIVYRAEVPA